MSGTQVNGTNGTQAPASTPDQVVRFGVYQADLQTGELRKNGLRIRLQGQPFQVLTLLLKRPGEVVTREELRRAVWPIDTFVDFDHALNTAVKKIRATLGDDADNPRFVETVPRRGYRFVAPVEPKAPTAAVAPPPVAPTRRNPRHIAAAAAIAVVVLLGLGLVWRPWRADRLAAPEFQRLTFDLPELGDARFTPDGQSVIYSAGWRASKSQVYMQHLGAPGPQSLGLGDEMLLSVSLQGELAVLKLGSESGPMSPVTVAYRKAAATLGRAFPGGATRELLPGVEAADWSPDGQLAVVRRVGNKSRLEFPLGTVLYETIGWIACPRFSPRGDAIAFLDHPMSPDDRGWVSLVDLKGKKRTLSSLWESERGLAWTPRGDELWFAATRSGVSRHLWAVNLFGQERRVLSETGGLSLQDISRDGRVLLTRDNERLGILFLGPNDKEPRDLSWKDWSIAMDISADGKKLLFGEEGEDSGPSYQVGLRPTDGSPPVMLGSGNAQSLSPDGNWALSILPPPNDQIMLLPTGAGSPKSLDRGPIEHYDFARAQWFADAKKIVFVGFEPGRGGRCYVQSVDGGRPRPISAEGTMMCTVSPDGHILAVSEDYRAALYYSDASEKPDAELPLQAGELPMAWSSDGKFLYLVSTQQNPAVVTRFEVASGRRQPWKQLPLPGGLEMKGEEVIVGHDGQSFAFTYSHHMSDLYLVRGLN